MGDRSRSHLTGPGLHSICGRSAATAAVSLCSKSTRSMRLPKPSGLQMGRGWSTGRPPTCRALVTSWFSGRDGMRSRHRSSHPASPSLTPTFSPNGRWMAYSSSESGRSEIVVVPFPNTGDAKWPVSIDGGVEPWWSRDGREIFYRNSKQELVSARVEAEATFTVGTTTALFADGDYLRIGLRQQYRRDRRRQAVSHDSTGRRRARAAGGPGAKRVEPARKRRHEVRSPTFRSV